MAKKGKKGGKGQAEGESKDAPPKAETPAQPPPQPVQPPAPQQPAPIVPEATTSGAGEGQAQSKKSKRGKGKQQQEKARAGEETLKVEEPQPPEISTPKDDIPPQPAPQTEQTDAPQSKRKQKKQKREQDQAQQQTEPQELAQKQTQPPTQPQTQPPTQLPIQQQAQRDTRSQTPVSETSSQSSFTSGRGREQSQRGRGQQQPRGAGRGVPTEFGGRGRATSPPSGGRGSVPPFSGVGRATSPPFEGRGTSPQQEQAQGAPSFFAPRGGRGPAGGRGGPQAGGRGRTPPIQQPQEHVGRPATMPVQEQPRGQTQEQFGGRGMPPVGPQLGRGGQQPTSQGRGIEAVHPPSGVYQRPAQQGPSGSIAPPQEGAVVLVKQFEQFSIAPKKNFKSSGTLGRRITVETNHFPLSLSKIVNEAIHYDITITPDRPKRMMRPVWEAYRRSNFPNIHPAFDEVKNVYSPKELPKDKLVGTVTVPEDEFSRPKEYSIVIKFAARINLLALEDYINQGARRQAQPQLAIQCLDIVLRNAPALRFVKVGRSYFTQPRDQIILGDGFELWHGFYQSAILGWKPYLNVDVAHKGFPMEMSVIDLILQLIRTNDLQREMDRRDVMTVSKYLKGLKVRYMLPNQPQTCRSMRVNGCSDSAVRAVFVPDNGEQTTIYEYFKRQKNYTLRYPNLPCIWVGSRDKKIYIPAELCTVLRGQVTNRKMNESQTRAMVKNAATPSGVRKNKIYDAMGQAQFNNDPCVRAFGISVGNAFERVPARVLQPPTLQYSKDQVLPSKGVWRPTGFVEGKELTLWTVFVMCRTKAEDIDKFVNLLIRTGPQHNMTIRPATKPYVFLDPYRDIRRLKDTFEKYKTMELIFVIVPDGDIYSKVKQAAELQVGCLTQCIKERTLWKSLNPATVSNIILKVNTKLNGRNHRIADICRPVCLRRPCMIMGADVTHPSPDQKDKPSIAAVAASHDPTAFQYNFCWRLQPARKEIILDLEDIVAEQLMYFHRKTNFKPESIIFFRDGVSEGQFKEVLDAEFMAIRKACSRMNIDYKPKITFLVVQKRHHTRFFPTNPRDSEDRNFNVPAGTCVDTDIKHPTDMEYYLVSHASIQGVARPTKYRMLWDDRNMDEDEIQTLTYYLCHMFTRCARSVSYPAPTYYAHLAAFRASVYFEGRDINLQNLAKEQLQNQIKEEICKGKPMFFV